MQKDNPKEKGSLHSYVYNSFLTRLLLTKKKSSSSPDQECIWNQTHTSQEVFFFFGKSLITSMRPTGRERENK